MTIPHPSGQIYGIANPAAVVRRGAHEARLLLVLPARCAWQRAEPFNIPQDQQALLRMETADRTVQTTVRRRIEEGAGPAEKACVSMRA